MLSEYLEKEITTCLNEKPTDGQISLIKAVAAFILSPATDEVFIISGYAGTGKTTIVAAIIQAIEAYKIKTMLLAPTGRAAKVLSSFSQRPAYTIHKKIYRQQSSKDGFGKFVLGKNLNSDTLFFVDEASMIGSQNNEMSVFGSGNLLNDLLEYVYSGTRCKLIIIGDSAQLPPVGLNISPALEKVTYKDEGFSANEKCLTQVVRQSKQSGILHNATLIRRQIEEKKISIPKFETDTFADIIKLPGNELINELSFCYEKYGINETMVVCRTNKRANLYNNGIRASVIFRDSDIEPGDLLMVVKNNYYWLQDNDEEKEAEFIANGDIVEVVRLGKYEERYGYHFVDALIRLPDKENREVKVKLMLEILQLESAALGAEESRKFFYQVYEDYMHLKPKKAGYDGVRNDPYYNALQVKFAYAVTCHKAQGGQWKAVFIDPGWFTPDMLDVEYLRWLYTAVTRASERLYLVNFDKSFFE